MRALIVLTFALAGAGLTGCHAADPNSRVYQAMNNQPNACGPGFKPNIDAC